MEVVDFFGGFWSQNTKENLPKNPPEIRQPETKNPPAHDPPVGGVFRAWVLGHSSGHGRGSRAEMHCSCNLSAAPGGRTRFAAHPSRQHF